MGYIHANHKYYNFLESDWPINPPIRALIGHLHVIGHFQSEIVMAYDYNEFADSFLILFCLRFRNDRLFVEFVTAVRFAGTQITRTDNS